MSEAGHCSFVIGARMLGLKARPRDNIMAMRQGAALELPVIEHMESHGAVIYHKAAPRTGPYTEPATFTPQPYSQEDQLELHTQIGDTGVYFTGHIDGLITIGNEPTSWLRRNLPGDAYESMLDFGGIMLLEVKTMSQATFEAFIRQGLRATTFTENYISQIAAYIGTAHNWGAIRDLLHAHGQETLDQTLVVAYAPATKEFAFKVVDWQEGDLEAILDALEAEVVVPVLDGQLPEPSYDGRAAACHMCDYSHLCPAAQALRSQSLDDVPILAPTPDNELAEMDALAAAYDDRRRQIKALQEEQKITRNELERRMLAGVGYQTDDYRIKLSEVMGSRRLDMDALKALAAEYGFALPYAAGRPYTRLYLTPIYGPTQKGDD
jgi:hypothetical protein